MTVSIEDESKVNIAGLGADSELRDLSAKWMLRSAQHRYTYNFRWLGRPSVR